jgi:predicted transcriptional regulator
MVQNAAAIISEKLNSLIFLITDTQKYSTLEKRIKITCNPISPQIKWLVFHDLRSYDINNNVYSQYF